MPELLLAIMVNHFLKLCQLAKWGAVATKIERRLPWEMTEPASYCRDSCPIRTSPIRKSRKCHSHMVDSLSHCITTCCPTDHGTSAPIDLHPGNRPARVINCNIHVTIIKVLGMTWIPRLSSLTDTSDLETSIRTSEIPFKIPTLLKWRSHKHGNSSDRHAKFIVIFGQRHYIFVPMSNK